ncbi:MAG: xanthine dehydrogenase family protein [Actinobacteria bacterium]|nr:xanthine dehydrogenase family protein [Thermoleophilia bacterium]MCB9011502.1 xanthine dehydrogenase family protein [Actinomycetota bacterium]
MTTTPAHPRETGSALGHSVPRKDAAEKLRGRVRYVGDTDVPGMLHGKVLRSEIPAGRIRSIDATAAEAMPGVRCVLVGTDLLDIDPYYGHAIRDRPIIAIDRVRFAGEPVAVVAAETEEQAEAAVRAIRVEYEPTADVDLDAAIAADAPLVHDEPARGGAFHGLGNLPERMGNVCYRYELEWGDIDAAFAAADVVVEGTYDFGSAYQYSMETHACIAQVEGDEITMWANCQHPFLVRAEMAAVFGVPLGNVRIIVPFLGGGFGSKSYTRLEPLTIAVARKAGRPVRVVNRVDEAILTSRQHGARIHLRTAARSDGTLLARQAICLFDTGAYADNGPRVVATAGDSAPGPYRWEAATVVADCVYTNTSPAGSYRAFGAVQQQWAGELQVDEIARRIGMDPLEIRRKNLLRPGEDIRPGGKPLDADLVGDIEKVAANLGWGSAREEWVGRGLSVGVLAAGAHPVSCATVRLEADGHVTVNCGTTEVGQGARTVMPQIAAEVLGLSVDVVRMGGTDTRFTPYDRSTGASRSTTVAGLAVQRAAEDLRRQLEEIGGGEADPADYRALMQEHFGFTGGELIGRADVHPEGSGSYAEGPVFWEVCVAAAEVEVDPDTGVVRARRTATCADVGRAINPAFVERQDEGATMQGLGTGLFEEVLFEGGRLATETLLDYRVPTTLDVPAEMSCVIVENADGPGPFGAKGCGEGALAAVAGAMATALADAGVPMNQMPLTPERVWRRIQMRNDADPEV